MAQVMTESQVPTDALARLRHLYSNLVNGGVRDTASAKRIAEGLLAPVIEDLERRTSAPVGVGEVAERYRNAIASACEGWTMPDGLRKHLETALWSPPTPQPTQAQATEPVAWLDPWTGTKVTTDYDAYGKHGIPLVRQQPVAREPLTDAQREKIIEAVDWYNFPQDVIDAVERAHGIKGGQHG